MRRYGCDATLNHSAAEQMHRQLATQIHKQLLDVKCVLSLSRDVCCLSG